METQNNLNETKRYGDDGVRINLSRDGKWVLIRVPGLEKTAIRSVQYFVKILERAVKKSYYNAEQVKQ